MYSKEILPIAKANKPIQSFARPEKTGLVANSALPLRKALMYLCLLPALPVFERGMSYDTYYKNEQNCLWFCNKYVCMNYLLLKDVCIGTYVAMHIHIHEFFLAFYINVFIAS